MIPTSVLFFMKMYLSVGIVNYFLNVFQCYRSHCLYYVNTVSSHIFPNFEQLCSCNKFSILFRIFAQSLVEKLSLCVSVYMCVSLCVCISALSQSLVDCYVGFIERTWILFVFFFI